MVRSFSFMGSGDRGLSAYRDRSTIPDRRAKARFERAPGGRVVTSALWRGAARRERGAGRLRPPAYGPVRRLLPGTTGSAPLPAKILPPRRNKSTSVVFTT